MSSETSPIPEASNRRRYHDLDALRAIAMLLGIFLHGLMSFIVIPFWPAQDIHQHSEVYGFFLLSIHGYRMPLFFLVSGFFTAMMFKHRGMRALLRHRARRILIPLVLSVIVLVPLVNLMSSIGGKKKALLPPVTNERGVEANGNPEKSIWDAAKLGDQDQLARHLDDGAEIDGWDDKNAAPLHWAAGLGHTKAVALLLERGAKMDIADGGSGSTPLHWAAFLGQSDTVRMLLEAGADPEVKNRDGNPPSQSASVDRGATEFIGGLIGVRMDFKKVQAGRTITLALLEGRPVPEPANEEARAAPAEDTRNLFQRTYLTHGYFLFHHLWFLYDLIWLVAVFALVVGIAKQVGIKGLPAWIVGSPLRLLWLVPLTFIYQVNFNDFGPDTAAGLRPNVRILGYYGVFFGFGALCYGRKEFEEKIGRHWILYFIASTLVLFVGLGFMQSRGANRDLFHPLFALCSALYAWLVIFGFVGVFRKFCSKESRRMRYISDSSYWLYLGHLPLIMLMQIWVSDWPLPSFVKLVFVCVVTTGILLLIYEFLIRYTWVGTMLNGKRIRPGKEPSS